MRWRRCSDYFKRKLGRPLALSEFLFFPVIAPLERPAHQPLGAHDHRNGPSRSPLLGMDGIGRHEIHLAGNSFGHGLELDLHVSFLLALVDAAVALQLFRAVENAVGRLGMSVVVNSPFAAGGAHDSIDDEAVVGVFVEEQVSMSLG